MKALKRVTCVLLTLSLLFGDNYLLSFVGIDYAKHITAVAATVTDCYDAYDKLIDTMQSSDDAASQLKLKKNTDGNTRVKTAGASTSPDMSTLWKLNPNAYKYGVYKGYFTYEQSGIDAAAQVKSGTWLNKTKYESMTGTPTTEKLFVTLGGTQWIVDLQYRIVQTQYLRRYHFNAGAANYCFYRWGAVNGGSASNERETTTPALAWNFAPESITFKNAAFREEEGYSLSTSYAGDQYQYSRNATKTIDSTTKRVPTKDMFHTGAEIFRHDAALSDSLTPNQYTAIATKKHLYNTIKSFLDGFNEQDDNYRADQGMSDPAYDDTGNFLYYTSIGWNYTYFFMARKSYNRSNSPTSIEGSTNRNLGLNWTATAWHPCFVSYLHDWQSYHNSGGVNPNYPSATLVFPKFKDKGNIIQLWLSMNYWFNRTGSNYSIINTLFPIDINYNAMFEHIGVPSSMLRIWNGEHLMYTYSRIGRYAPGSSLDNWLFFDRDHFMDNVTAFGFQSESYPMKLSHDMLGNAVSTNYSTPCNGYNVDLVHNGYNAIATMYMYAMYYIFLNYGPLFYKDELDDLFGDCPWYRPNSNWTPSRTNAVLGCLFGATTVEEYNDNAKYLSALRTTIPLAAFPRGGDLDSQHTWGNALAGKIESGAITEYNELDLFGTQVFNRSSFCYTVSIDVRIYNLHEYNEPGQTHCIQVYAEGGHCSLAGGVECTGQAHTTLAAPSNPDHSGNYMSGYKMHTSYSSKTEQSCNCSVCGTCSSCKHSGNCPESDGKDDKGKPIKHSHSKHNTHSVSVSSEYNGCHHTHYPGENATHDSTYPSHGHASHTFTEKININVIISTDKNLGNFVESPKSMGYGETIGQLFTNVQWLDITSYQVWMMERGQSKGLAKILAAPIAVDKDSKIIRSAVVDQKGFTVYNVDDADNKEPTAGLATLTNVSEKLEKQGRVANSFNRNSAGNNELTNNYVLEFANEGFMSQMGACTLSFLGNDAPAFKGQPFYSHAQQKSRFRASNNYVNGDVHAFMLSAKDTGNDDLYFWYNPYSQGGRSSSSFNGFVTQALAHTLYYPAKDSDEVTPNPFPNRGGHTYWVSYSNSLRIQGDYIGIDYMNTQSTKQQTLAGYMYDTWDEKDSGVSCSKSTHGHKFKLVKDSEDNYIALAKYNVRCTWVPGRFSYLMSRGPVEDIFGGDAADTITCTNNCFMIHTYCRGINADTHSCWDSISGDSGAAECAPGQPTDMGNVSACPSPRGKLADAVPNDVQSGISQIKLNYWGNKTPYTHIQESFKNSLTYNDTRLYATMSDAAPYVGYGANANGGIDGTHDISANGGGDCQQGYRVNTVGCKYNVQRTMVSSTPYVNSKGIAVSFKKFGVTPIAEPQSLNAGKNSRGTDVSGANTWSSKYPWLQNLDVNRYLANDRYSTGSAQIEYASVGKHKDSGQNTVYAHTESSDVPNKNKYYYRIDKFGNGYLTADKVVYVNAAYRRATSVGEDNFYGNPNDIVIYNPVSAQSAHVVPVSKYLPDATNVGTKKSGDTIKREYSETYLKSFCTYVKRDSRLSYKYPLAGANGYEASVNTSSIFLANSVTSQEYTTEEYYSVSTAPTTYYTTTDYNNAVGGGNRITLNNSSASATITDSAKYNLQYVGASSLDKSIMSSIYLYSGDVLKYDTDRHMLYLKMVNNYTLPYKSLVLLANKLTVSSSNALDNAVDSLNLDTYGINQSDYSDARERVKVAVETWSDCQGYISSLSDTARSTMNEGIEGDVYDGKSFTASTITSLANKAIETFMSSVSESLVDENSTEPVKFPADANGEIFVDGAANLRGGETIKISISANQNLQTSSGNVIDGLVTDSGDLSSRIVYTPNGSYPTGTMDIYVEAMADDVAFSSVKLQFNSDVVLSGISVESMPVPVLTAVGINSGVLDMNTIDHYTGNSSWSVNSYSAPQAAHMYLLKTSTKSEFEGAIANSFMLESEAFSTAGVTIKAASVDPHKVWNANWRNYIIGWKANGSTIESASVAYSLSSDTMLTAPSGFYTTVGALESYAENNQLYIYVTDGVAKLAINTDSRWLDAEGSNLYIKSSYYGSSDPVDKMLFTDTITASMEYITEPKELSFYQSENIRNYMMSCIYFASTFDSITYDVSYSTNDIHKYTSDSPNYPMDVFTTTTTRYMFTEETYEKIFGSYVSLDDEFTIYWDNYADLVNNDSSNTEGTYSDVKLTHKILGRGWDNRADSQKNADTTSTAIKNSSVYSDWSDIKKNSYWKDMESSALSKVTDCTKWIYTKYVIFNVDMYAFATDKSYVYDDTKGPLGQDGKWDPTTPAFRSDGTPNHIVYIPAGQHVYLGYNKTRSSSTQNYGTNDDNGRFVDFGYRAYHNSDGTIATPDGAGIYTRDPNGDLYTYHFWLPLSDGESDRSVTVQYVVNAINSVADFDADADKNHIIDNPSKYPDTSDSLGDNSATPTLSGTQYGKKQSVTKLYTGASGHKQTHAYSSAVKRGLKDEWDNEVVDANGLQILNNVLGITDATVKQPDEGLKYYSFTTGKTYRRANNTVNSSTLSVVGSVGNFIVVDVGDPRYQDTFKVSTTDNNDPTNYFMYPVVKSIQKYSNVKGEEGSQDYYMSDYLDARGRYKVADANIADMHDYSYTKHGGDTYSWNNAGTSGSAAWYLATTSHMFTTETKVPNKHTEIVNDDQSIKVGYEQICSVETIGNYFGSREARKDGDEAVNIDGDYGQSKLQIIPMYYAYNTKTGETVNVDVYMKSGSTYTCINAGSEFANESAAEKAYQKDSEAGTLNSEPHYYDGPYYLDHAYNNAYTYGLVTNTAGDDGSTYLLDQNMLRYSITAKEASVTYDICRNLAQTKNNVALKKGISTSLLERYDYSDVSNIGGTALDTTYAYGNAQIIYLREYNRTFIGGTTAALSEKLPSTAFSKAIIRNAGMYAQKWYFGLKLPSSTVFVRHGEELKYHKVTYQGGTYTTASTDLSSEEGWVIYCRLTLFAIGDKYILITHSKPSLDSDQGESPSPGPDPGPDPDPDTRITTLRINLDKQKSTVDLEGRGSH